MKSLTHSKKKKKNLGQTVIEFALVSILFVFMLFFTFNAILAFCVQEYLSYAVFMAARAYQASAESPDLQTAAANRVLRRFVVTESPTGGAVQHGDELRFPLFGKGRFIPLAYIDSVFVPPGNSVPYGSAMVSDSNTGSNQIYIGINFSVPLAIGLPHIGGGIYEALGTVNLQARSFLGREVTKQECTTFFQTFLKKFELPNAGPGNHDASDGANSLSPFMEDNGC